MSATASSDCRGKLMPLLRHVAFSFRVQPRLLHHRPEMSVGQGTMGGWQ